jgi:peptidoglycan/xylan/chitin deacetylase (PgdA/CDA1 family)
MNLMYKADKILIFGIELSRKAVGVILGISFLLLNLTSIYCIVNYDIFKKSFAKTDAIIESSKSPVQIHTPFFYDIQEIPILLYHHIVPIKHESNSYVVSKIDFEEQMKYLFEKGYATVNSDQLYDFIIHNESLPSKSLVITFDDGYASLKDHAYEVLKKYDFQAMAFVMTKNLVEKPSQQEIPKLSMNDIQRMKDVFEFGSHTYDMHKKIHNKSFLQVKEFHDIQEDLDQSQAVYKTRLFSYPYGDFNDKMTELLEKKDFVFAFHSTPTRVTQDSHPLLLGRIAVNGNQPIEAFKIMVDGWADIEEMESFD